MKQQRDRSNEQEDAALVACQDAGDREAFDILLQRHASSVQRLCTSLLGTTVEAQDIAQEAALQAFLGLSHLREPARFAAWFHAIAANLARSALRRRSERSLETLSEETMTHLVWIETPPTMEEYQIERDSRGHPAGTPRPFSRQSPGGDWLLSARIPLRGTRSTARRSCQYGEMETLSRSPAAQNAPTTARGDAPLPHRKTAKKGKEHDDRRPGCFTL